MADTPAPAFEFVWKSAPKGQRWHVRLYVSAPAIVDRKEWLELEELSTQAHSEDAIRAVLTGFGDDRRLVLARLDYLPDR